MAASGDLVLPKNRESASSGKTSLRLAPDPTHVTSGGQRAAFSQGAGVTGLTVARTLPGPHPSPKICFVLLTARTSNVTSLTNRFFFKGS